MLVATDPPYYDNIGYADLSDYFFVWLRQTLKHVYPSELSTLLTPKSQELIATPYRFSGDKLAAEKHFESGMARAFSSMVQAQISDFPLTLFYAFKQSESKNGVAAPTGWETMLEGLLRAGFSVSGTLPMRTELTTSLKATVGR